MWTLHAEASFSSAHANGPAGHKCNNMHGHDWKAIVEVTFNKVDECGWGPDFGAIKAMVREMDHKNLNEFFKPYGFPPSAEYISQWLYGQIRERFGFTPDFVTIVEGDANSVTYRE